MYCSWNIAGSASCTQLPCNGICDKAHQLRRGRACRTSQFVSLNLGSQPSSLCQPIQFDVFGARPVCRMRMTSRLPAVSRSWRTQSLSGMRARGRPTRARETWLFPTACTSCSTSSTPLFRCATRSARCARCNCTVRTIATMQCGVLPVSQRIKHARYDILEAMCFDLSPCLSTDGFGV